MNYSYVTEFFGKEVEVTAGNKTFNGILRKGCVSSVVELSPINTYQKSHWVRTIIVADEITAIKILIPRGEKDEKYDDDCDDCGECAG